MERGANTFPFHNLIPYSESNESLFLYFLPSLNWIKEKSVATLAIRTFAIQKTYKVSSPYYRSSAPSKPLSNRTSAPSEVLDHQKFCTIRTFSPQNFCTIRS